MNEVCEIHLGLDGAFHLGEGGEQISAFFFADSAPCWWLYRSAGHDEIVRFDSLDTVLRAMVISTRGGGNFRVVLPCGASFSRPGRLSSEQVLANFGYAIVSQISSYVLYHADEDLECNAVVEQIRPHIDFDIDVVSCGLVDLDEPGLWCAELRKKFEGALHLGSVWDHFEEAITGDVLELCDVTDTLSPLPVKEPRESVIRGIFNAA